MAGTPAHANAAPDMGHADPGPSRLMLVLPLAVHRAGGDFHIERQAANGLRLWLSHFDALDLFCPLAEGEPPAASVPIDGVVGKERLRLFALPTARRPLGFAKSLFRAVPLLRRHVATSRYIHVAIGGIWGDWGSVTAVLAWLQGRRYAIWTDSVASRIARIEAKRKSGLRSLYGRAIAALTWHYERFIIARASLGLFHGADCYQAYAPYCRAPHLVHDIHLPPEAAISQSETEAKIAALNEPLDIIYVGRATRDKGIFDWLETLKLARRRGLDFTATWYGEGEALEEARAIADAEGLQPVVSFPGNIDNHPALMRRVRAADLFLFCHKVPESPRCLVEALISGTPIVGYGSAYSEDLISAHGGGVLTPINEPEKLAAELAQMSLDRLSTLTRNAAGDGASFNDEATFEHRSELMKTIPNSDPS